MVERNLNSIVINLPAIERCRLYQFPRYDHMVVGWRVEIVEVAVGVVAIGVFALLGLFGRRSLARQHRTEETVGPMRVVQIEPGPMPILTASAPASISALAPSAVATLPAITWQ